MCNRVYDALLWMGSFRILRRDLLGHPAEAWVREEKRGRGRESLPCLALLCQAAAWHRADGGIARAQTTGNPRERAEKDKERDRDKRDLENKRHETSPCSAMWMLFRMMNREGHRWNSWLMTTVLIQWGKKLKGLHHEKCSWLYYLHHLFDLIQEKQLSRLDDPFDCRQSK